MTEKTYNIYSARLHYHEFNKLIGTMKGYTVDAIRLMIQKPKLQGGLNINPFYAVIIDVTDGAQIIEYNRHLAFVIDKSVKK